MSFSSSKDRSDPLVNPRVGCVSAGAVHEYFVRDDDEQGALLLDSANRGVIGMCPITELVSRCSGQAVQHGQHIYVRTSC